MNNNKNSFRKTILAIKLTTHNAYLRADDFITSSKSKMFRLMIASVFLLKQR